ncbi:MAG: hypothetical protein LBT59_18445 [Clostridiales bacterium]|jgi:hypothetical protein|nr:hypothetical protein [Clostridiales bacterium]
MAEEERKGLDLKGLDLNQKIFNFQVCFFEGLRAAQALAFALGFIEEREKSENTNDARPVSVGFWFAEFNASRLTWVSWQCRQISCIT